MENTINTHGFYIDIESLKNVAARTEKLSHELHQIISIDLDNGEVLYWCDMANNWVEYRDPAVIEVLDTRRKYGPQALADAIADGLREHRHMMEYIGEKCTEYVFTGNE